MRVVAAVLALLGLGGVVAWQVDDALRVTARPADVPVERPVAAAPRPLAPPPGIASIGVPDEPRLRLAATAVADALVERGRPRPTTGATGQLQARLEPGLPDEAYRLDPGPVVVGSTPDGVAAGLYAVADRIRAGAEVVADGRVVAPRLGLRLTDLGSVGLPDDPARFAGGADYSLNSDVVGAAVLPDAPYVDQAAVDGISRQFRDLVHHALADGYNAVVVPGFLEYVTFDGLGVHAAGDPHPERAEAMTAAFGPVWRYAHEMGVEVYLSTDMLALSPPLRSFLEREVGGLRTEDERLWRVYRAALSEVFERLPDVDGMMIRIGEGGSAYRFAGWDYTSEIAVTTPEAVRAMLRAFLAVAAEHDREIVFRTWSVGIGEVGDLHTSRDAYERVLGGLHDDRLIVSTKYALGDFYSHLPLNDTLLVGRHRRIVEFQSRREFEGLGALPDDMGELHRHALRAFLANPRVEGVWTWRQGGGPLLAGPRVLDLRTGFWQLYDLNSYVVGRLARDPEQDPADLTADWVRRTFSHDPDVVHAVCRALALSREAITTGLYVGPYARHRVRALGLEPPPMMWIFEWDIPTGDSATWGTVYAVGRDRVDEAVAEGSAATGTARRMRELVGATDPAGWRDPVLRERFVAALDYQVDLFGVLAAYRAAALRHTQWLDTGDPGARDGARAARAAYGTLRAEHLRRYGDDLELPAYNLTAADLGLDRAARDEPMAWAARGVLLGLALAFALGWRRPWARALTGPWRRVEASRADRALVWVVPAAAVVLSRAVLTWFAAPAHLVPVLVAWALFALVLRSTTRGPTRSRVAAAVGAVALLRSVLLLGVLAVRGPGAYWFGFWTAPAGRAVYVAVAVAAFLGVFAAAYAALRGEVGRAGAAGRVLAAAGTPLAVLGAVVTAVGLERALTAWNDQSALLPWGLSRILGITAHLEVPTGLPVVALLVGGVAVLLGAALLLGSRRRSGATTARP
ncbi:hypothetical protein [Saccharothrix yanglingensis]|uniref:Glycosyl hydrolase family 67 C-terminal domain-containing protein n=1 Tax=Saccharothrix yanglingensis TaxID=659496 RepID=A0ABU0X8P1_9PSEU|nr:hypothetical protein [Saccharothrix yanglingensis]MDQ2588336.1 hypothetical protein [Saccharothrix yanglingensis]